MGSEMCIRDRILLLDNGTVDLDEVFTTALVLAMDSKHVCSEDCKGLCATCGADLNEGPCGCKPEIDPRFAALAQLLDCLLYTSPSPRDGLLSRMPSSA